MHAAPVAAPASPTLPEQHTFLQSLLYIFLPAAASVLIALLGVRLLESWQVPTALGLIIALTIAVVAIELGVLYFLGWRRNGRLSLEGIVLYRERVPAGKLTLLALGAFLWSGLVMAGLKGWLTGLLLPAFAWLPPALQPMTADFAAGYTTVERIAFLAIGLVGTAWIAPYVEELYFRGFLLPRMQRLGKWAALVNAILFSLYHFWSPYDALSRIFAVAPMVYGVQATRSIQVSVWTHWLTNTAGMLMLVPILFG